MEIVFTLLAVLAGVVGFASLTPATTGVGLIGVACLLAIFGRLAQAAEQHRQVKGLYASGAPRLPL